MTPSRIILIGLLLPLTLAFAETENTQDAVTTTSSAAAPKVKYKAGKDVNFDELLIQGDLKRPEVSIVTGNVQQGTDGLLRLRENFTDRISMDAGEELQ